MPLPAFTLIRSFTVTRRTLACLVLGSFIGLAPAADEGFTKLFNGKDLTGWKPFLEKNADPAKTWSIADGVIRCVGQPMGYLLTEKEYGDYVLRVQWRWPGKGGNSGVFVHVSGPDQIWPKAVEAQLQSEQAGDFWLVDGFKLTIPEEQHDPRSPRHYLRKGETWRKKAEKDSKGREVYEAVRKSVEKPIGEWNQYEITCRGNEIRLVINGQLVNVGTNAESTKGKILLQSEGTPIEFRNIEINSLK
jgi:hypothetical protein